MTRPRLTAVVAVDHGLLIGADGDLPWRLPGDLRRFRAVTMGHPILMGRATYASIGRPLPGRQNVVITRNRHFEAPGCDVVHSIDAAIEACGEADEAFVIGGSTIYEAFWPHLDRLHLTVVHDTFEGDTWFRGFDLADWRIAEATDYPANEKDAWPSTVFVLERRAEPGVAESGDASEARGVSSAGDLAETLRCGAAGVVG